MQFQQLNLISPLLKAVQAAGYVTPSPIQEKTIPLVLSGRDVLGCAQTGTGKTAAFALPILQRLHRSRPQGGGRPIRALILTPTRELAIQIFENFRDYGHDLPLRTAVIFGGVGQAPQVEALKAGVDILVATPGRLNDLIGQGFIRLETLEIFVLDEADRMLDMGFLHDVKKVIALLPKKRQTLFFSATMPPAVEELALGLLTDPATVKISPVTKTVDKIAQSVFFVKKADKVDLLLWLLEERHMEAVLVFNRTKHGANQLAEKLTRAGVQAMAIHGNKSQTARQEALGRFKAGKLRVLVATDIAARGIDVAELPFVINFHVPDTPEAYIHRIGRTGRAGLEGEAITLCCAEELEDWRDIEKHTKQSVPVGTYRWSVTDMQPEAAPPREPRPPRPEKAQAKQKAEKPPRAEQQKPKKAPRAEQPKPTEKPRREEPKQAASVQKPQDAEVRQPAESPAAPRGKSGSMGAAYAARYGSRPVRPFQSRVTLAPKAEDFPPPPAATGVSGTRLQNWSADDLPERRRITGDWDTLPPEEEAPSPAPSAPAATPENGGQPKRRRHRGGRRHHKSSANGQNEKE